jgi:hypothetical protein
MRRSWAIAACILAAVQIGAAAVKVHVDLDKTFDFSTVKSWAWSVPEAGRVIVGRTPTDDPEAIRRLAEPVIMDAIVAEMPTRGLTQARACLNCHTNIHGTNNVINDAAERSFRR